MSCVMPDWRTIWLGSPQCQVSFQVSGGLPLASSFSEHIGYTVKSSVDVNGGISSH